MKIEEIGCIFEIWNYKYNQFTPCQILEKLDSTFVRIRGYAWKENRETGEHEVVDEYTTTTYLKGIKNIGTWDLDIHSLYPEGSFIRTKGYEIIIDCLSLEDSGNIKLFYKYIQCEEEQAEKIRNSRSWSWINGYNSQFKKIIPGYNFITLTPNDRVEFVDSFKLSRLEEHRKEWCFEDPVDRETIVHLEKLLGYIREDGKTWMEYFWEGTDGKKLGIKIKDSGDLVCFDVTDPKKPVQVCSEAKVETFIEKVVEHGRN